jgi:hypothetical protein
MNITHRAEKVAAVGCTHGEFINPKASKAVLKFVKNYKPKFRIHLGDAYDTRAFRTGSKGSADETAPIYDDIAAGQAFLYAFEPTVFTEGNHDFRPRHLSNHPNSIIAAAAKSVHEEMMQPLKDMKTKFFKWTVQSKDHYQLGGFEWWHGVLYGENYLRDTANRWGNSVVAHAHRAGMAKGVRSDNATAFGVGTLANIPSMEYAQQRAATLAWSSAIVYGEIFKGRAYLKLHEWPQDEKEWNIPTV